MEENNQPQVNVPVQSTPENLKDVSFPVAKTKKRKFPIYIVIVVILVILAALGYFILNKPSVEDISQENTFEPTLALETPTPVQESVIERGGVKIEVLNGSGITGAAGKLKTAIEDLGYSDVKIGNAKSIEPSETVATFSSGLSQSIKDEILSNLKVTYESVSEGSGSLSGFDVQILIGYPKGYTPSPTEKANTPTSTPKPTTSISPSVTVTSTLTPTP